MPQLAKPIGATLSERGGWDAMRISARRNCTSKRKNASNVLLVFLVLSSANFSTDPGRAQGRPPTPYVVDASGQVIGRFYAGAIEEYKADAVILRLKPSGVVVSLFVSSQGFSDEGTLYYKTTDCTGDAYFYRYPAAVHYVVDRALRVGDKIFYPSRDIETITPLTVRYGGDAACSQYQPGSQSFPAARGSTADVAAQGFKPPFSFQFR